MARSRRRALNPARREKRRDRHTRPKPAAPAQVAQTPVVTDATAEPSAQERRPITRPAVAPAAAASRRPVVRTSQPALHTDWAVITRDLRRVGLLTGILLVALAVLTFVLR